MQAMRERAGLATSLGTKPLPAPFGLFAVAKLHYATNVFARGGGPQTSDATRNEGPGEKRAHRLRGCRRSTPR